jgi:hypothetical protein
LSTELIDIVLISGRITWDDIEEKLTAIVTLLQAIEEESKFQIKCSDVVQIIKQLWNALPKEGKYVYATQVCNPHQHSDSFLFSLSFVV